MRIRFRFAKLGKIRFTSQRDVARMWERALRRAVLPVAYTEGFSPRPQLSFGLALPTGCESLAEYVDVAFDDARAAATGLEVEALPTQLGTFFPEGIEVEAAAEVERGRGSLQQQVTSCSWTITVAGLSAGELAQRCEALLGASSVPIVRERKGRLDEDDLRPSVLALAPGGPGEGADRSTVLAELATQPRGVRPGELVAGLAAVGGPTRPVALGDPTPPEGSAGSPVLDRACRTQQWIERDGSREEPLRRRGDPAAADRAAHALERAS